MPNHLENLKNFSVEGISRKVTGWNLTGMIVCSSSRSAQKTQLRVCVFEHHCSRNTKQEKKNVHVAVFA